MVQSKLDRNGVAAEEASLSSDAVLRQRSSRSVPTTLGTSGRVSDSHHQPERNKGSPVSPLDRRESSTTKNGGTSGTGLRTRGNISILHLPSTLGNLWNEFFHAETTQVRGLCRLRAGLAVLVFCSFGMIGLDFDLFFAPGPENVNPLREGRLTVDEDTMTIFSIIPQTRLAYWSMYAIFMAQVVLMGLGVLPRFQTACVFVFITSFHHHSMTLWNSEDTVLRILCFFLLFFPPSASVKSWPMWPIRLMQIEMCLIYISSGILKFQGKDWTEGHALWYVVHLNDFYGMFFNPSWVFGNHFMLKLLTYATLVLEAAVPILVWCKPIRPVALLAAVGFHLSLDLSMNLNFFHWIMIVGWMSFCIQPAADKEDKELTDSDDQDAREKAV